MASPTRKKTGCTARRGFAIGRYAYIAIAAVKIAFTCELPSGIGLVRIWIDPMSIGIGTCPACGTQNHLFRRIDAPVMRELDEQGAVDEANLNRSLYLVHWTCSNCGLHFTTDAPFEGSGE
jgi:rubredoxin